MKWKWLFRRGDLFATLAVSAEPYADGTAYTAGPALAILHRRWLPDGIAFDAGFGWDAETPIRPWPVVRVAEVLPRSGTRRTGIYWMGLYASVCWGRRSTGAS